MGRVGRAVSRERKQHKAAREGRLLPRVSTASVAGPWRDLLPGQSPRGTEPSAVTFHAVRGIPLSAMVSGVATPRRGPEGRSLRQGLALTLAPSAALRGQGARQSPADGFPWVSAHRPYDTRHTDVLPERKDPYSPLVLHRWPRRGGGGRARVNAVSAPAPRVQATVHTGRSLSVSPPRTLRLNRDPRGCGLPPRRRARGVPRPGAEHTPSSR